MARHDEHYRVMWDLFYKGMEAVSLLPPIEYPGCETLETLKYLENLEDFLLEVPVEEELSEAEQDKRMLESFRRAYKGSKAVELFDKAIEMSEKGYFFI